MDLFESISGRRSIRRYMGGDVEERDLTRIMDAGLMAPSAGNIQPWELILVKGEEAKRQLAKDALNQSFIAQAAAVIVVCVDLDRAGGAYGGRGVNLYCLQDTGAAIQNMLLITHALGLGACWVGAFDEEAVTETLEIPSPYRPVALIPIGQPAEKPLAVEKRQLGEILHRERF